MALESLPVELIAEIMAELDLESLILVSSLSHRLRLVASDPSLNPWRRPILRTLYSDPYEPSLQNLSVRTIVPRQNWVEILSIARPAYLIFNATLPNLKEAEWEECFKRRFLPGLMKWKKETRWKEAFMKILFRLWHRTTTPCTSDEAWTKYIVLNRNGSANELDGMSRNFNALAIFNELKLQNNLAHLETHIRLVVQLADVRILALGVLGKARGSFSVNENARAFLHPPSVETASSTRLSSDDDDEGSKEDASYESELDNIGGSSGPSFTSPLMPYWPLTHPLPAPSHANYPYYTPGGKDKRWIGTGPFEESGLDWLGGLMIVAQLVGPNTSQKVADGPELQDLDLVLGPGRSQFCSFTWNDLFAIAPWIEERITKRIDGVGLGN